MIIINKVILMGRLTRDPEIRYSTNGNNTAIGSFIIAVDRRFQKQGEERKADFPKCKAFGKTAEFISKYFKKGSLIAIVGEIQTGSYDDAEGKKVYTTDVMVSEAYFAGSKQDNNKGDAAEPESQSGGFYPIEDEDLPF